MQNEYTYCLSYITAHKGDFKDLKRCINSVEKDLAQIPSIRYEHLICLDGVNHDNESKYFEKIPNLKLIVHRDSQGKAKSVNELINLAQGEYLFFLDSDDWNLIGRTFKQLQFHRQYNAPEKLLLGSNYLRWDRKMNWEISDYPLEDRVIKLLFWRFPYILYSSMSFHRKLIDKSQIFFNENLIAGLDYDYYSRMFQSAEVWNLSEPLAVYTESPYGLSQNPKTRRIQLETHKIVLERVLSNPIYNTSRLAELLFRHSITGGKLEAEQMAELSKELAIFSKYILTDICESHNYFPNTLPYQLISDYFSAFAKNP